MNISNLPPLREVIRHHRLNARKILGQHFLLDMNLTTRIARAAGKLDGFNVIEIGPGPGGLTRALLNTTARQIFVIEKDKRCIQAMTDLKSVFGDRLQIIAGDALKIDLPTLIPTPRKIVANLPYNTGTPMLLKWLQEINAYEGLTLMFQSEVADRLSAAPRTRAYSRLSIISQWLCEVKPAFRVSREAFTPPPKVTSTIVSLRPHPVPLAPAEWDALGAVTAAAFGQRRKMLRSSLKSLNLDLEAASINPTSRAEELSIEAFCALAQQYADRDG